MSRHDAFDELAQHDPIDQSSLPSHDSPQAQRLLADIVATPRQPGRTSVRHRRVVVAIAVGIAAVAALGAGWIVTRPVTEPQDIVCYQAVDLDSDRAGVGYGDDVTAAACERFWADGTLTNPEFGPAGSVPPLVACVSAGGSLAVFPTNDPNVCHSLDLGEIDEASLPGADTIRGLNDALVNYFASDGCVPIPRAVDDVRGILDTRGFAHWTIVETSGSPDRICASFSMGSESETVFIVPIPKHSP